MTKKNKCLFVYTYLKCRKKKKKHKQDDQELCTLQKNGINTIKALFWNKEINLRKVFNREGQW